MHYTIYNPTTGQITETLSATQPDMIANNLIGKTYIEGAHNAGMYYIKDGVATALPADPSSNELKYTFDWTAKTYTFDVDKTADAARTRRNSLLMAVDKINPVWYASLTADQQAQLEAFRTALLNVPQQSGFPTTIEWPTKPSWL